jgi:hypothetical protein
VSLWWLYPLTAGLLALALLVRSTVVIRRVQRELLADSREVEMRSAAGPVALEGRRLARSLAELPPR